MATRHAGFVSGSYFDVLGARVSHVRPLADFDAAVIRAATARAFWPNLDPIGRALGVEHDGSRDGATDGPRTRT